MKRDKKKLLASTALFSLLFCAVFSVSVEDARAAIALVSHTTQKSVTSNGFTTAALDTTGANFIIIGLTTAFTGGTISDSNGNTWTPLTEYVSSFSDRQFRFFYCESCTVGSGHTFTVTGTGIYPTLLIAAFSGVAAASSFDVQNGNANGFSTSVSTNSVTPSVDNELVVAGLQFDVNDVPTIDSGFTMSDASPNVSFGAQAGAMAYLIETTATAKNPTFSWSPDASRNIGAIATFKAAAGGGGGGANGRIIRLRGRVRLIGGVRLGGTSPIPASSCAAGFTTISGGFCQKFLTSGTTFTVPANWNSSNNTLEAIGGGGGGNNFIGDGGDGGGGGAYSKISNLSLAGGASVTIHVGTGGAGATTLNSPGSDGGDSWFNAASMAACVTAGSGACVGAKGGQGGQGCGVPGSGGASGSGVGTTKFSGGTGGVGTCTNSNGGGGAGGGGAAGPSGAGGVGGRPADFVSSGQGAGGGGANNGATGGTGSANTGGNGGNDGFSGSGGGVHGLPGGAGTLGGGGGGSDGGGGSSAANIGGAGGTDQVWDSSHGAGGGGGGGGGDFSAGYLHGGTGGAGGLYGGGGAGGGIDSTGFVAVGGTGAQGIIVITYHP